MKIHAPNTPQRGAPRTDDSARGSAAPGRSPGGRLPDNRTDTGPITALQHTVDQSARVAQLKALRSSVNTAGTGDPIQLMPVHVANSLAQVANQDPAMVDAPFIVTAVSDWLTAHNIPHRLGGSLAARLQGAGRTPNDLDIEVPNPVALLAAYHAVTNMNVQVTVNGLHAQCQAQAAAFQVGLLAVVNLRFVDQAGRVRQVSVDIVNENNPQFNQHLQAPAARGVAAPPGDLVQPPELLMNYLDRLAMRQQLGIMKQDHIQILQLLRAHGFHPNNPQSVQAVAQSVAAIAQPGAVQAYLHILTQVINWGLQNPGW